MADAIDTAIDPLTQRACAMGHDAIVPGTVIPPFVAPPVTRLQLALCAVPRHAVQHLHLELLGARAGARQHLVYEALQNGFVVGGELEVAAVAQSLLGIGEQALFHFWFAGDRDGIGLVVDADHQPHAHARGQLGQVFLGAVEPGL